MTRTVHVRVTGTVQGVGYRAFVERMASRLGLDGWVRNRRDGSVEAMFSGESRTVEAMLTACRSGPRLAVVADVAVEELGSAEAQSGFDVLPTE
jgi:acylphosphatase